MHANWWPSLLAHIPNEEPWAEASVPVASLRSFDGDPIRPGERRSYTVLIPLADIDAVVAAPAGLRSSLVTLGVAPMKLEGLRGLKLLDYVVRLSQVAVSTGYLIPSQAQAILDELEANGTDPARPLEHLFALYDLRIVGSHAIGDAQQELVARLNRFGTEPGDFASGFGQVLDTVYDALAEELEEARRTLTSLLGKNQAYWAKIKLIGQKSSLLGKNQAYWAKIKLIGQKSSLLGKNQAYWAKIKLIGQKSSLLGKNQAYWAKIKLIGQKSSLLGKNQAYWAKIKLIGQKSHLYQRPPDLTQGDSHERRDLIQWHQGKGGFDGSKDYAKRQVRRRASPGSGAVPGWESGATDVGDCPGSGWG